MADRSDERTVERDVDVDGALSEAQDTLEDVGGGSLDGLGETGSDDGRFGSTDAGSSIGSDLGNGGFDTSFGDDSRRRSRLRSDDAILGSKLLGAVAKLVSTKTFARSFGVLGAGSVLGALLVPFLPALGLVIGPFLAALLFGLFSSDVFPYPETLTAGALTGGLIALLIRLSLPFGLFGGGARTVFLIGAVAAGLSALFGTYLGRDVRSSLFGGGT